MHKPHNTQTLQPLHIH